LIRPHGSSAGAVGQTFARLVQEITTLVILTTHNGFSGTTKAAKLAVPTVPVSPERPITDMPAKSIERPMHQLDKIEQYVNPLMTKLHKLTSNDHPRDRKKHLKLNHFLLNDAQHRSTHLRTVIAKTHLNMNQPLVSKQWPHQVPYTPDDALKILPSPTRCTFSASSVLSKVESMQLKAC
jgi:hypothetical protein